MSYQAAYTSIPTPGNPRETEAWALTEAARRIVDSQRRRDHDAFLEATRLNWRLWTLFQVEITGGTAQLPADVRRNMLSLCHFVDKTTLDIIAEPELGKADILVDINRQLAAGLIDTPATGMMMPRIPDHIPLAVA